MVRRVIDSDADVVAAIEEAVRDITLDAESRALALEALASARVPEFETVTLELTKLALHSPNEELQLGGLAASSDLPQEGKKEVLPRIVALAESSPFYTTVRRVAQAFVRRHRRAPSSIDSEVGRPGCPEVLEGGSWGMSEQR